MTFVAFFFIVLTIDPALFDIGPFSVYNKIYTTVLHGWDIAEAGNYV